MPVLEVQRVSIWGFLVRSSSTSLHCPMAESVSLTVRVAGEPALLAVFTVEQMV